MRRITTVLLFSSVALLAACGTSRTERAISGGAIGAGSGAAAGAILGGDVGTGAVLGGIAGAATGAATEADDIYLGDTPF